MNCRIVTLTCLLAWTANTGFGQDKPLTEAGQPKPVSENTLSEPWPNQPPKAESDDLADTLFKGEWKLHSANLIYDGIHTDFSDARYPRPQSGWIKDGVLNIGGENIKFEVVMQGESHAIICGASDNARKQRVEIKRTRHLLFLTWSFQLGEASEPPDPNVEARSEVTQPSDVAREVQPNEPTRPEGIILEFWRIDPRRKVLVQRMEFLNNFLTELETSGSSLERQQAQQEHQEVASALRKIDSGPAIASGRNQILQVRKSGDHSKADRMEKMLARGFHEGFAATQESNNNSVPRQSLFTKINTARLEYDTLASLFGASHPKVIEAKRQLETKLLLLKQTALAEPAFESPVQTKAQLQQTRDQLLVSYDEAEQQAQKIASSQKPANKNKTLSSDQVAASNKQLTQAVRKAFDLQQQLLDTRLQLAEADLRELQAKHQRRKELADQIIQRRVQQLQDADEAMLPTPFSMSSNESINVPAGSLKNNSLTIAFPDNQTHFQVGQKAKLLIQLKELPPREAGRPFSVEVEVPEQFEILGAGTSEIPAGLIATRVVRFDLTKTTVPQMRELPIRLQAKQIGAKCQIRAHLTWQDWKYERELDVTIDSEDSMKKSLVETQSAASTVNEKAAVDISSTAKPGQIELLISEKQFGTSTDGKTIRVHFDDLDLLKILNVQSVSENIVDHFPQWLKDLNGKRVRIRGFMLTPFQAQGLERFTLARDNSFVLQAPEVYHLIDVRMTAGQSTNYIDNKPFDAEGVFRIKPVVENGELYNLYQIEDASVNETVE